MLGFFRKNPKGEAPTEKQAKYAKRLGIHVTPKMTKSDVSMAISAAEGKDPALKQKRKHAKEKAREAKLGKELIDAETAWRAFSENIEYMLAVYQRGQQTIVDVLRVNDAYVDGRRKLKLMVAAPKLVKDRHIGDYLDWDRDFELAVDKLLHHEPLHAQFQDDGIKAYNKAVKRGMRTAKKTSK